MNELVRLTEAAKFFPQNRGKHPHIVSLRRWILDGIHGIRLEARRIGGQWFTSRIWVENFIASGTDRVMQEHEESPPTVKRSIRHRIAMERLKRRLGIDDSDRHEATEEVGDGVPDPVMQEESSEAGPLRSVLSGCGPSGVGRKSLLGAVGSGGPDRPGR